MPGITNKITVLVADDHAIVRRGLRAVIESNDDMLVVAEAANGRMAIEAAKRHCPDVIVMDLAMPEVNGLEATRRIRREMPKVRIVALTSYEDRERVLQLLAAGAGGYVTKQNAAEHLIHAIREVRRGSRYLSPNVRQTLSRRRKECFGRPLTCRERTVLKYIAQGVKGTAIAIELGISPKTVDKHRQKILDKLDIHETAGITRYAVAHGIVVADSPSVAPAEAVER